jgi:glycine/D-amino acid oxidase-like deaminating enzyme
MGVRASTFDRMPMVGSLEGHPNLYYYFGNGSKGMIWSSLLGKLLARNIVKNEALPKEVAIQRFAKRVEFG